MKILNRYVGKHLLIALALTIAIATFAGVLAVLGKLFRLAGGNVPLRILLLFVWYNVPNIFCYILPLGVLMATVLLFNRMSSDNEVTALRASGVSLLQIIAPVILLGVLISGLCAWLQFSVSPTAKRRAKWLLKEQLLENPIALLNENSAIEIFKGYRILIGAKRGTEVADVHIVVQDPKTGRLKENITARAGEITVDKAAQIMLLKLKNATIVRIDPDDPNKTQRIIGKRCEFELPYARHMNRKPLIHRVQELPISQLCARMQLLAATGEDRSHCFLELHWRAVWALAPFTFILIGIPLGLQIARHDNYSGLAGSVVVAVCYYIPIMLFSETMPPRLHPELFMWLPNLLLQAVGLILLWRRR